MVGKRVTLGTGFVSGHDFSRAETGKGCDGFSRCKATEAKAGPIFGFLRHGWKPCPGTNRSQEGIFHHFGRAK